MLLFLFSYIFIFKFFIIFLELHFIYSAIKLKVKVHNFLFIFFASLLTCRLNNNLLNDNNSTIVPETESEFPLLNVSMFAL